MITQKDLIDRFGEREMVRLTDKTNARQINETTLNTAIDDAVAEVMSYLASAGFSRQPENAILKAKTCDIARWYLYENGVSEIVEKRYQAAILWLKQVQKNPAMLGFDAKSEAKSVVQAAIRVMPNVLEDWKDANTHQF